MEEVRYKSIAFLLKRESLSHRKLLLETEERKGLVRVICLVGPREEGKPVFIKGSHHDRVTLLEEQKSLKFDRVLYGSSLAKLPHELERPLECVLEGNNICIISCGNRAEVPIEQLIVR